MKIALVSSVDSALDVLPPAAKILRSLIKGVQVLERNSRSTLDIVKDVSSLKGFDIVAAILYYPEENVEVKVMMEKLVELDLEGKETLKFFVKGDDFDAEKEAEKISGAIIEKIMGKKGLSQKSGKASYSSL